MFQVIRRPVEEAGPILKVEPLNSMIFDKWNRYSAFYYTWGILYVIYMAIYTACVVHRQVGKIYSIIKRLLGNILILILINLMVKKETFLLVSL